MVNLTYYIFPLKGKDYTDFAYAPIFNVRAELPYYGSEVGIMFNQKGGA